MAATPNNQPEKMYYLSLLVNKRAMLPRFYGIQYLSTLKKGKLKVNIVISMHFMYIKYLFPNFQNKTNNNLTINICIENSPGRLLWVETYFWALTLSACRHWFRNLNFLHILEHWKATLLTRHISSHINCVCTWNIHT